MQAAEIKDGVVVNILEVESLDFKSGLVDAAGAAIGYLWDGSTFAKPAQPDPEPEPTPTPTGPLTVDDYRAAIQKMLDEKVKERRYYDILNACSYATSTNATFKAEALACVAWRDAVWAKAYEALDLVQSGQALQPTIPGLLAMMPTLTWPEA